MRQRGEPKLVRDARALAGDSRRRVIAIGNFDGVHRGHRAVLERAALDRTSEIPELAALTFEPHPAVVLGASPPARLTRLSRKCELLAALGVDLVVAQTFDAAFSALTPEAFVDEVLVRGANAARVVVGHDFRFGAKRAGNLEVLRELGRTRGFEVDVQEVVVDAAGPLSSTRVRKALAVGDLDDARAVLGRPHAIEGEVVEGDRRGRTIGFPTANLGAIEEALPANGVYAVVVDVRVGDRFEALAGGVANVGVRPTIASGAAPSVEVHLFDLPADRRDLYDATLRVHLVSRLREERRFRGLDELRAQIQIDADAAKALVEAIARPATGAWF